MDGQVETVEKKEVAEAINLFVTETQSADAVIPIRWCVSKSLYEKLRERKIENPYLLIVAIYLDDRRGREDCRRFVPLDQMMEYIQFNRPGKHRILATVVWEQKGNVGRLKKFFLEKRSRYSYDNYVVDYYGKSFKNFHNIEHFGQGLLEVEVAKEFFAKEPSEWLKWWVNLWFYVEPQDQCQFRRRYVVALTIQPIAVLVWMALRFLLGAGIGLSLLLAGLKELDFSVLFHPFKRSFEDLWDKAKESILFNKRYLFIVPFAPVFPLLIIIILEAINWSFGLKKSILLLLALDFAFILFSSLCLVFYQFLIRPMFQKITGLVKEVEQEVLKDEALRNQRAQVQREKMFQTRFSPIICTDGSLKLDIKALPKEKRTIHLRYLGLKARICKPFARH